MPHYHILLLTTMVSPPSLKDIHAVYESTEPKSIHVNYSAVRIRDEGSDGDESRLPPAGEQVVLWDNTINVLEEADTETVKHWLGKIGNYLIHEGRGQWHNLRMSPSFTLFGDEC